LAFLKQHFHQLTIHPAFHINGVQGCDRAEPVEINADIADACRGHLHRHRARGAGHLAGTGWFFARFS
jgi:hypothetical protein